jgi:acetolactate synthase-1/2/3 large subunit
VVIILADNSGWFAIKDLQIDAFGEESAFGNDFLIDGKPYSPDFFAIAKAFGIKAYRENEEKGIKKAIDEAIRSNKPALIHIDVSRIHPHSGGKAFGWWDVPIPGYMSEKRSAYEKNITEELV